MGKRNIFSQIVISQKAYVYQLPGLINIKFN
jgi:hypothetical protein